MKDCILCSNAPFACALLSYEVSAVLLSPQSVKAILPHHTELPSKERWLIRKQEMEFSNYSFPSGRRHNVTEPPATNIHTYFLSPQTHCFIHPFVFFSSFLGPYQYSFREQVAPSGKILRKYLEL